MVKIRLMRIGAKKRPFYRVVAVDERNKRTGGYIELLGTYNPISNPKEINLKQDRIDTWIKNGAVMSDGFLRIIGKAPQKLARKPKKAPKETPAEEKPVEVEETVVESNEETTSEESSDQVTETPAENVESNSETEANDNSPVEETTSAPEEVTETTPETSEPATDIEENNS